MDSGPKAPAAPFARTDPPAERKTPVKNAAAGLPRWSPAPGPRTNSGPAGRVAAGFSASGKTAFLPGQDSNLDKGNQNPLCYPYTTGQAKPSIRTAAAGESAATWGAAPPRRTGRTPPPPAMMNEPRTSGLNPPLSRTPSLPEPKAGRTAGEASRSATRSAPCLSFPGTRSRRIRRTAPSRTRDGPLRIDGTRPPTPCGLPPGKKRNPPWRRHFIQNGATSPDGSVPHCKGRRRRIESRLLPAEKACRRPKKPKRRGTSRP